MDLSISQVSFTQEELAVYIEEFEKLTKGSEEPLEERVMASQVLEASKLIKHMRRRKISDEALKDIWELVRGPRGEIRFYNFLAASRLVSAARNGREINQQNMSTPQPLLVRKVKKTAVAENEALSSWGSQASSAASQKGSVGTTLMYTAQSTEPEKSVERVKELDSAAVETKADSQELVEIGIEPAIVTNSLELNLPQPSFDLTPIEIVRPTDHTEIFRLAEQIEAEKNLLVPELPKTNLKSEEIIMVETPKPPASKTPATQDISAFRPDKVEPLLFEEGKLESPVVYTPRFTSVIPPSAYPEIDSYELEPASRSLECSAIDRIEPNAPRFSLVEPLVNDQRPKRSDEVKFVDTQIKVNQPTYISAGILGANSYYIYEIEIMRLHEEWTVDRRYSDFDWLNTQLSLNYKGLMIPILPEKRRILNTVDSFVQERRAHLEIYLNQIANHPVLSKSDVFECFIHNPHPEFIKMRNELTTNPIWFKYASLEDTVDQVISYLQTTVMKANWRPVPREITTIESKVNQIAGPTQLLAGAFRSLMIASNETLRATVKLGLGGDSLITKLETLSAKNEKNMKSISKVFDGEHIRVEALRNALDSYKQTLCECAKHEAIKERKLLKQQQAVQGPQSAGYITQIQETESKIQELNLSLEEITQKLRVENSRWADLRTESLKHSLRALSEFCYNHSVNTANAIFCYKNDLA